MAKLPDGWGRTLTGEPMPDVAAAIHRSREEHAFSPSTAVQTMLARHGETELSQEDFVRRFGHLPTDDEG